jgi:DNA-directed RNA polymerase specialized sigma24 family protein
VRVVSETPGPDAAATETVDDVYRRLGDDLIALATLLAGTRAVAEEIVHDVFAAAIPRGQRSGIRTGTCADRWPTGFEVGDADWRRHAGGALTRSR